MIVRGLCYICGRLASNTCSTCGRVVCNRDYDSNTGRCTECKRGVSGLFERAGSLFRKEIFL